MFTWILVFTVFLKNRNIISKIKRSKVTDCAALSLIRLVICSLLGALNFSPSCVVAMVWKILMFGKKRAYLWFFCGPPWRHHWCVLVHCLWHSHRSENKERIYTSYKVSSGSRGGQGVSLNPPSRPQFLYNLWKWNNLVSVRPNYFVFMGYLRKIR